MRRDVRRDEQALTAVIEFLSAFVLFLVIVSAFLSLTRLSLGPNEPMVDRLDEHAADGLMRLTSSGGWAVPLEDGVRDSSNSTSDSTSVLGFFTFIVCESLGIVSKNFSICLNCLVFN